MQREVRRWWLQGEKVDCFGHGVEVLAVSLGEEDRSACYADAALLEPEQIEEKLGGAEAEAGGAGEHEEAVGSGGVGAPLGAGVDESDAIALLGTAEDVENEIRLGTGERTHLHRQIARLIGGPAGSAGAGHLVGGAQIQTVQQVE